MRMDCTDEVLDVLAKFAHTHDPIVGILSLEAFGSTGDAILRISDSYPGPRSVYTDSEHVIQAISELLKQQ